MKKILRRKRRLGTRIFPLLLILGLTSGCTFMEHMRGEPVEGTLSNALQSLERRTTELGLLEGEAAGGAPLELARARILLEEMTYFYRKGDPGEVARIDSLMGHSLDSIRASLDAGGEPAPKRIAELEAQNENLRSECLRTESGQKDLEEELLTIKAISEIEIQSLSRSLQTVVKERDDAIREVVRTRSRIEGMASPAGASAMFAEARVLVDRMKENAFNTAARGLLEKASGYLSSGKKELEAGNPGGAAYLFDLVSSVFEEFRSSDPERLTLAVRKAVLYKAASGSSRTVGSLSRGETVQGIVIEGDWVQVRHPSGLVGWVRKAQVR